MEESLPSPPRTVIVVDDHALNLSFIRSVLDAHALPYEVQVIEYDPVDQLLSSVVHTNTVTRAILKQFVYSYDKAANRTSEEIYGPPPHSVSQCHLHLRLATGRAAIGHVRYATCGGEDPNYAQPFERMHLEKRKWFAFAFNGLNIFGAPTFSQYMLQGAILIVAVGLSSLGRSIAES